MKVSFLFFGVSSLTPFALSTLQRHELRDAIGAPTTVCSVLYLYRLSSITYTHEQQPANHHVLSSIAREAYRRSFDALVLPLATAIDALLADRLGFDSCFVKIYFFLGGGGGGSIRVT